MFRAVRSVMPATKRRSIQIHANLVDAAFDDGFKRLLKLALVHVMLVLAHADGFRIDLD